ncbi:MULTISPECIES: LacI family DNA-binding transcriptional regulator [unclassified Carboxylicivirga]|uniref:LacI family DNA-binding transcriptional regulator n=1 Tax=Carboxylicivirga TaxID=1628153 RepID=UPI003D338BB1
MKPSIKTIAEHLGVSKTTVSFVLNGRGNEMNISAETQRRVLDTARKLNYVPNHLARSLSMGRSYTLGFVVPDISNPFFGKIARLVEYYAEQRGYSVMVASKDERADKQEAILDAFAKRQIDGVIIAPCAPLDKSAMIPTVCFDRLFTDSSPAALTINNTETAFALTENLVKKGCRHIGLLQLSAFLPTIQDRVRGYKEALKKHGMAADASLMQELDGKELKAGVLKAMHHFFSLPHPPDGILFLNNVMTAHALWAVNKYYPLAVDKLHFATFDNLDLFDYAYPRVVSALQPGREIAHDCVELLCKQIEDGKVPVNRCYSSKIIDR